MEQSVPFLMMELAERPGRSHFGAHSEGQVAEPRSISKVRGGMREIGERRAAEETSIRAFLKIAEAWRQ